MITHGRGSGASLGGDTTRGRSRRNARRSGPASTTATGLGNNNNESTNLSAHGQRRTQVLVTTSNAAQVPQIIPHRRVHHGSDVYRTPPFARNTEGNRQEWLRAGPLGVAVTLHDARAAWTYRFDSEERLYATVNPFALQPGSRNQQPRQGQGSTADPDRPLDGPRSPYVPPDASAVWNMDSDEFRDFQDRMEFELERTERTQWRPQNVRPASNMPKPSALTTEQMMVERQCKICWEQLATVATLPCGMSLNPKLIRVSKER